MEDYKLINNKEENQYEFLIDDFTAKIEYILNNNGEIYLTHTEVPPQLERQGIGTQLVEKTLKDIDSDGYKVVPLCPFVIGYIQKNPEWKRIVMKGIRI